jgi:hypothetical protein
MLAPNVTDSHRLTATPRSRVFGGALVAVVIALVIAFQTGCTVRLIGDYDDTIDKGVTDIQQRTESYFAKLRSNPNTIYDQSFYDDVTARLAVLKTRASSLEKYVIIDQQISNLQKQYADLQKLDQQSKRPIASAIIDAADNGITVSIESILKLELALKRGSNPSS